MKRPYETVMVFDGTLPDEALQKEQKQIEAFLQEHATFEKTDVWGKRALAYPIRKKRSGYFCVFIYEGEGNYGNAIEKHVKLNENVLRHLTVVRNVKNDIARAASAIRREKAAAEGDQMGKMDGRRDDHRGGGRFDRFDRYDRFDNRRDRGDRGDRGDRDYRGSR